MSCRNASCLLVHCNDIGGPTHIMSMGLFAIAGLLRRNGFQTEIVHTELEALERGTFAAEHLLDRCWSLIGISCHWAAQLDISLKLAQEIKRLSPNTPIVFGGFTSSFFCLDLLKEHPAVDFVICGEGELPLLQLLEALDGKQTASLAEIPNLAWRNNGRPVLNPHRYTASAQELDDLPFDDLDLLKNHQHYPAISAMIPVAGINFDVSKTFYLCVGRGCPVQCSFCGGGRESQALVNHRQRVVFRSPRRVLATMKKANDCGYSNFFVSFDPDPKRRFYAHLFELIRSAGLRMTLTFGCWSLPTRDFIDDVCRTFDGAIFEYSPETSSEEIRRRNRGFFFTNHEMESSLEYLGSRGLYAQVYFSFYLPFESLDDINQTREYAWTLNDRFGRFLDTYYLPLSTDPASPLQQRPDQYDMTTAASSLSHYVQATRERPTTNILCHRAKDMTAETASKLESRLTLDLLLRRAFKGSFYFLSRSLMELPRLLTFLDTFYREQVTTGCPADNDELRRIVVLFQDFVSRWADGLPPNKRWIADLFRYEGMQAEFGLAYAAGARRLREGRSEVRRLPGARLLEFRPLRQQSVAMRLFEYDVECLAAALEGAYRPSTEAPDDVLAIPRKRATVLLHAQRGSLERTIINEPMRRILEQCDGATTIEQIVDGLRNTGPTRGCTARRLTEDTMSAIRQLDALGIVG